MRYESSVTGLSWIPSEAITGTMRTAFDAGLAQYDPPPPGELGAPGQPGDIKDLQAENRFRFANVLRAWIEVDGGGAITGYGYAGDSASLIGATEFGVGPVRHKFRAIQLPDIQRAPEAGDGWVRFSQTAGGKTGMPTPRRVAYPPFVQWQAPTAWSTLVLTLYADGHAEIDVPGASSFPRHWVYDGDGKLARKSGITDFSEWYRKAFGKHTPWGDEDSAAMIVAVETALERSLSVQLMHGHEAGREPAADREVRQGRGHRPPGPAGHRRLPDPGRHRPRRARRRAAGRVRARRDARRARPPGGRRAHRLDHRGDAL